MSSGELYDDLQDALLRLLGPDDATLSGRGDLSDQLYLT
jgi:hypothetical protein